MSGTPVGEPVSAADSRELFERWRRDRDRDARDELIARFLPLARKLARRYVQSSEPYDDLVQVASLGLVKAVERFDPDRGFAFTSFAVPTIVGELKRYFRDTGWAIHVDRGAQERARRINEARQAIGARTGGARGGRTRPVPGAKRGGSAGRSPGGRGLRHGVA